MFKFYELRDNLQRKHLSVQWVAAAKPWELEPELVRLMQPPLNRDHNKEHPFDDEAGRARERLREIAGVAR